MGDLNYQSYFPEPESKAGWRYLKSAEEVRSIAGMDAEKLDIIRQMHEFLYGGDSWGIVIIRRGYLVREFYTTNVLVPTRFDVWSVTKSFTSTAWGILFDDSRNNKLPGGKKVDLDSYAYEYIPEGYPLTDPRKERITIGHLLSMTSGIPGVKHGVIGMPTSTGNGPFEHALGRCPNRYGKWVDKLTAEPGTSWDYSDPAFAHLSLAFKNIMNCEMSDYLKERVFDPIGIENLSWDVQGGSGFIGPHTNAHTGIHISARELARFGYLFLRRGKWKGKQIVPERWIDLISKASQDLNPSYSYSWLTNSEGTCWPELPRDTFSLNEGYRSNRCFIIPSLDLVVARVGSGPAEWKKGQLVKDIIDTVID
ncbi:MAG TPA: serine hydrolase [Clostridiaceae bacterium]|nr:serine hydrolase [Clostridiaceae bacterium]